MNDTLVEAALHIPVDASGGSNDAGSPAGGAAAEPYASLEQAAWSDQTLVRWGISSLILADAG